MPENARLPALAEALARHERFIFGLCYRMTGSVADAEDLVQDTFERALRHRPDDRDDDVRRWLTTVAMNACRDHLRRRKVRGYDGPFLPAPIETVPGDPSFEGYEGPEARYGKLESVSLAFLRAIEALTPNQRAVLLLRDVFDFSVRETAEILETTEASIKTQLHRARHAMEHYDAAPRERTPEDAARALRALRALIFHVSTNDVAALRALLRQDAVMWNDGGGEFFAARKPVIGAERIITFHRKTRRTGAGRIAFRVLNGAPALVAEFAPERPGVARRMVCWVTTDATGRIEGIYWQLATRKLAHLGFEALTPLGLRHVLAAVGDALRAPGAEVFARRLPVRLWQIAARMRPRTRGRGAAQSKR